MTGEPDKDKGFVKISRALLSVSDKEGVLELAKNLNQLGVELLSTGGTAKLLKQSGLPVIDVSDYTGFPEMMDGRLKTLHPLIHGGILARRNKDQAALKEHDIKTIDLVIVNLYPFQTASKKPNPSWEEIIENIDIGGPTMIRGAAKNFHDVAVLTDPKDYLNVIHELQQHHSQISLNSRFKLAQKAFAHTAHYDSMISNHFNSYAELESQKENLPAVISLQFAKHQVLRYGENPHQEAALYKDLNYHSANLTQAISHQGKELSYNNLADSDAAITCLKRFPTNEAACVIVKHANPCGVALGKTPVEAYQNAYRCDPTSAFGGIIALNQQVTMECAKTIIDQQFVEVLLAPSFSQEALTILQNKTNLRVLSIGEWTETPDFMEYRSIEGGLLVQEADTWSSSFDQMKVVSKRQPTQKEWEDLLFAWEVVKSVKSNAIVYAKNTMTIGIGAGQMSRVFSARIAAMKAEEAGLSLKGAVMASDAFFPFRDSIDIAAEEGITAVIQPGGSVRDEEVIQAANESGLIMIFTGTRHFKH